MQVTENQMTLRRAMLAVALVALILTIFRWNYRHGYWAFLRRRWALKRARASRGGSTPAPGPSPPARAGVTGSGEV